MGPDETIDIATLLANLSRECSRLAVSAEHLDCIVGDIAEGGDVPNASLARLQEMDHLRQALAALQCLTSNASTLLSPEQNAELNKGALAVGITLEGVRTACLETAADRIEGESTFPSRERSKAPIFF